MLGNFIRKLEPTRPITSAVNELREDKDPYFQTLDVAGYNYAIGGDHNKKSLYELDHARMPGRIMYCSESYPLEAFGSWMAVLDHPYVIGDFVWTAWDYIGEASIGWRGYLQFHDFYPWTLAYCGDMDICGWKRPQSFYRDTLWKEGQISLFVKPPQPSFELNPKRESWSKWHFYDLVADWTWPGQEGKPLEVTVFSSCDEVELTLNGKSLGKKPTNRSTEFTAAWRTLYLPGALVAIGYNGGKQVGVAELFTAAPANQLRLQADRTTLHADGQDLSYVTVELADAKGVRHPKAEDIVEFEIEGPATIVGVGNGNPLGTESYQHPRRKAWRGRCLVVVKAGRDSGGVVLRTKAQGFMPGEIRLRIQ
jgi:beta-galactosidase